MSDAHDVVPLIGAAEIAARVEALAEHIVGDYGTDLVLVPVLKGAFVFAADLMRALSRHGASVRVDFLRLSSYGAATRSSGRVTLIGPLPEVAGARVLVVEDVLDTGRSARFAVDQMVRAAAAEVRLCTLLDKPSRRTEDVTADYVGFVIPDRFVVGYGIDWNERYRERPDVAAVEFRTETPPTEERPGD